MADVQLENGFIRIASELIEALAKQPLPPSCMMVFLTILRKTYGFGKPIDSISLSQFCLATGLKRPEVCKAIRRLAKMTMIGKKANGHIATYWIIKDFDKWTPLAKQPHVAKQPTNVGQIANQGVAKQPHTIDTLTIDTLTIDTMALSPKRKAPERRLPSVIFQEWADSPEGDAYLIGLGKEERFGMDYVQTEFSKAVEWVETKQKSPYAADRRKARKSDWARFIFNWLERNL